MDFPQFQYLTLIRNNEIVGQTYPVFIYATNSIFSNNVVHDNVGGRDAMWVGGHDNTISQNEFYQINIEDYAAIHTDVIQTSGDGPWDESYNIIFERNFVHDSNCQPGNLSADFQPNVRDWIIRNNIFLNMTMAFNIGVPGAKIYNNTFYNCAINEGHPLNLNSGPGEARDCSNQTVKNNVFIGNGGALKNRGWYQSGCTATLSADYNYVAEITTYDAKSGFSEVHGINGGNPLLMNPGGAAAANYQLNFGSPLLNAGVTISSFSNDYAGNARPSGAWDIGAYEYVSGATVAPPAAPTGLTVR